MLVQDFTEVEKLPEENQMPPMGKERGGEGNK